MLYIKRIGAWALIAFFISGISLTQEYKPSGYSDLKIKPSIGLNYFSQTVNTEGEDISNEIKSLFFTLKTDLVINNGFSLGLIIGYSLSNFDAMVFRQLPLSLETDVGSIGGFLGGIDLQKNIFHLKNVDIDLFGQFLFYSGSIQNWDIPNLNVTGSADGKPSWTWLKAGSIFTYTGYTNFFPHLTIRYNKLWGKFNMDETIQNLSGNEEKKLTGKSNFGLASGFLYKASDVLGVRAEAEWMPHSDFKNSDFGFNINFILSFN